MGLQVLGGLQILLVVGKRTRIAPTVGLSIEHPASEFTVQLVTEKITSRPSIKRADVLSKARLISKGEDDFLSH
jgi:hypothetical protein